MTTDVWARSWGTCVGTCTRGEVCMHVRHRHGHMTEALLRPRLASLDTACCCHQHIVHSRTNSKNRNTRAHIKRRALMYRAWSASTRITQHGQAQRKRHAFLPQVLQYEQRSRRRPRRLRPTTSHQSPRRLKVRGHPFWTLSPRPKRACRSRNRRQCRSRSRRRRPGPRRSPRPLWCLRMRGSRRWRWRCWRRRRTKRIQARRIGRDSRRVGWHSLRPKPATVSPKRRPWTWRKSGPVRRPFRLQPRRR